jgi:hypothetical protein
VEAAAGGLTYAQWQANCRAPAAMVPQQASPTELMS